MTSQPTRRRVGLLEALEAKENAAARLASLLDEDERKEAERDHHAWRKPRPCGLTIHTGTGCSYGCIYCYVPDMGFPMKPHPYPLSPLQIAYAVAINPYVAVGPHGTPLALGSVTEPFLEETREKSLEYIEALRRYLDNPLQASTKAYIDENLAGRIKMASQGRISLLVSISTIRLASILEPGAPSPKERLRGMGNAAREGLHVSLFLRPIIPGVTEHEVDQLLEKAAESGARGVVPGSLRVTPGILHRLRAAGIDTGIIEARLPRRPRGPRDQVSVDTRDIRAMVAGKAAEKNLKLYPAACSATMDAHGLGCSACRLGPCGEPPIIDPEEIPLLAERIGLHAAKARMRGDLIIVEARGDRREAVKMRLLLEALAKRRVAVRLRA